MCWFIVGSCLVSCWFHSDWFGLDSICGLCFGLVLDVDKFMFGLCLAYVWFKFGVRLVYDWFAFVLVRIGLDWIQFLVYCFG